MTLEQPSSAPSVAAPVAAPVAATPTYRGPFAIMTVLFFMWGFMTVWNDILIPRFKDAFTLNYFQAMLVQFAFSVPTRSARSSITGWPSSPATRSTGSGTRTA